MRAGRWARGAACLVGLGQHLDLAAKPRLTEPPAVRVGLLGLPHRLQLALPLGPRRAHRRARPAQLRSQRLRLGPELRLRCAPLVRLPAALRRLLRHARRRRLLLPPRRRRLVLSIDHRALGRRRAHRRRARRRLGLACDLLQLDGLLLLLCLELCHARLQLVVHLR